MNRKQALELAVIALKASVESALFSNLTVSGPAWVHDMQAIDLLIEMIKEEKLQDLSPTSYPMWWGRPV